MDQDQPQFTNTDHLTDATANDISSTSDFAMPSSNMLYKRRNSYTDGEPPAKKSTSSIQLDAGFKWNLQALTQAANAVQSGGKSPVSALNELGVRVSYTIMQQAGPAHCPNFTVVVNVADMKFEGWGHSKREARASAARSCLSTLLAKVGRVLITPDDIQQGDFTQDEALRVKGDDGNTGAEPSLRESNVAKIPSDITEKDLKPQFARPQQQYIQPAQSHQLFGVAAVSANNKSDINRLYELCPGLHFDCTHGDGSSIDAKNPPTHLNHNMRFKVVCEVHGRTYEGYGSSKKLAKLAAARSALAVVEASAKRQQSALAHSEAISGPYQMLYDKVAKLVNEKFNQLVRSDTLHSKRKVLAGIVISDVNNMDNMRVIAVTTGTKCISGAHMSVRGLSVNDTHAEVCARRCLQRHLYSELAKYADSEDPTVPIETSDLEPLPSGGYSLRSNLQVHLYVSTAPCGDSRIFSPHEPQPDNHPNRMARGQLRTKIESGEGTIPVKNSNTWQTWDGVIQGERLLTMSCSDKVCKWCVVGMQGALLSTLLRPVYPHTLVLGALLHHDHMQRALHGRIEHQLSGLPPPFCLTRPALARAASAEQRTPAKAPNFALNWSRGDQHYEIINCTTGKLESGQPSLLCKQSMFARWLYLVKKLPLLPQTGDLCNQPASLPEDIDFMMYDEAKRLATTYQEAKRHLYEAFDKAKLGKWVKKPLEQEQFPCELVDADPNALFTWTEHALDRQTHKERSPSNNVLSCNYFNVKWPEFHVDEVGHLIDKEEVKFRFNNEHFDRNSLNKESIDRDLSSDSNNMCVKARSLNSNDLKGYDNDDRLKKHDLNIVDSKNLTSNMFERKHNSSNKFEQKHDNSNMFEHVHNTATLDIEQKYTKHCFNNENNTKEGRYCELTVEKLRGVIIPHNINNNAKFIYTKNSQQNENSFGFNLENSDIKSNENYVQLNSLNEGQNAFHYKRVTDSKELGDVYNLDGEVDLSNDTVCERKSNRSQFDMKSQNSVLKEFGKDDFVKASVFKGCTGIGRSSTDIGKSDIDRIRIDTGRNITDTRRGRTGIGRGRGRININSDTVFKGGGGNIYFEDRLGTYANPSSLQNKLNTKDLKEGIVHLEQRNSKNNPLTNVKLELINSQNSNSSAFNNDTESQFANVTEKREFKRMRDLIERVKRTAVDKSSVCLDSNSVVEAHVASHSKTNCDEFQDLCLVVKGSSKASEYISKHMEYIDTRLDSIRDCSSGLRKNNDKGYNSKFNDNIIAKNYEEIVLPPFTNNKKDKQFFNNVNNNKENITNNNIIQHIVGKNKSVLIESTKKYEKNNRFYKINYKCVKKVRNCNDISTKNQTDSTVSTKNNEDPMRFYVDSTCNNSLATNNFYSRDEDEYTEFSTNCNAISTKNNSISFDTNDLNNNFDDFCRSNIRKDVKELNLDQYANEYNEFSINRNTVSTKKKSISTKKNSISTDVDSSTYQNVSLDNSDKKLCDDFTRLNIVENVTKGCIKSKTNYDSYENVQDDTPKRIRKFTHPILQRLSNIDRK